MTPPFARPRLDRRVRFDERSRQYGIAPMLTGVQHKKTLWEIPRTLPLDQGREGACVGFGWSAELAVGPIELPVSNSSAQDLYANARRIDQREGSNFPDGASVLAGAKVCRGNRTISTYRWMFGIEQVVSTLCEKGPVVLGIPWHESMYETDSVGRVTVNGPLVGGHCILAAGFIPASDPIAIRLGGDHLIPWINSWGRGYGVRGVGFIRVNDLANLLKRDGEAVMATDIAPRKLTTTWWEKVVAAWNG